MRRLVELWPGISHCRCGSVFRGDTPCLFQDVKVQFLSKKSQSVWLRQDQQRCIRTSSIPPWRQGCLTQLRKRVKASRSSNKITPPSSPTSSSRMVSPPMSPTHEMVDNQHPLHHHQQQHQHHDASSERLLILAQAVRVAMVLEAGSNVCKESNFSSVYC
ncbi:heat shock factor family protein [Skeletonema marinoi]|uniref:Heat shock factor family protein n=1 Tax=Skeletonema marinoi TaxID=267567 RepID=A0AAD8XZR1_9STRA|nr:heat shock factor family protein [Skeletonema marinoi]